MNNHLRIIGLMGLVFSLSTAAHAKEQEKPASVGYDYRCVIGADSNLTGRLKWYKSVTLKQGEKEAKLELGDDLNEIDKLAGLESFKKSCGENTDKSKCLAELQKKREEAKEQFKAKLTLRMIRAYDYNISLDGFTDNDEKTNDWDFIWNKNIPFNQGQAIHIMLATDYEGPGLLGTERHYGFNTRDNTDLFLNTHVNADGTDGYGVLGYHLTCARLDDKFADPTVKVEGGDAKPAVQEPASGK